MRGNATSCGIVGTAALARIEFIKACHAGSGFKLEPPAVNGYQRVAHATAMRTNAIAMMSRLSFQRPSGDEVLAHHVRHLNSLPTTRFTTRKRRLGQDLLLA